MGELKYLSGPESFNIDQELMGDVYGFSVDQLMELAGLAVAHVCYRQHPPTGSKKVLVLVGPGSKTFYQAFYFYLLCARQWRGWIGHCETLETFWLRTLYFLPKAACETFVPSRTSFLKNSLSS